MNFFISTYKTHTYGKVAPDWGTFYLSACMQPLKFSIISVTINEK